VTARRALLFDLDGTLTDNYVGIATSIRYALARLGEPAPADAALAFCVGPPLRETFARLLGSRDRARIESAIGHYRERYNEVGWRENVVYDGVDRLLGSLADAGERLFVCTAKPEVFARRIVAHFGFDRRFAGIYGADLAGALDDKAKLLRHMLAAERLDAIDAVMIGDRGNDVRAARANDVRSIGVLWGYGSRDELAGADALAATPRDLALHLLQQRNADSDQSSA
jgi:phosphoglycolate phosphatase